jgi:hypothetical protein
MQRRDQTVGDNQVSVRLDWIKWFYRPPQYDPIMLSVSMSKWM